MDIKTHLDELENEIVTAQYLIEKHDYAAQESDYEIVNEQKTYKQEYMNNMPYDYATLLGRFGTLIEVKEKLEDTLNSSVNIHG